jgi:hypothetical protein
LVQAIAGAALQKQRQAKPGTTGIAPGRSAAIIIRHHVPKQHRSAVHCRVREHMRSQELTEPLTAAQQVVALPDPELFDLVACGLAEIQRRHAPPSRV